MKNTAIALLLFGTFSAYAQGSNFYTDKWKVLSLVQKYKGNERTLFHRDSAKNILDYKYYGVKFAANLTYTGTNDNGKTITGTWSIAKTKDSMTIDGLVYDLQVLTTSYITLRSRSLEIIDTLRTLDTLATDLTLYSLTDLTTSFLDGALESESIKVFPNPTKHNIAVHISGVQKEVVGKLLLADLRGHVLKTVRWDPSTSVQTIDFQELHAGIYLLEIIQQDGRRMAVKKIVKE